MQRTLKLYKLPEVRKDNHLPSYTLTDYPQLNTHLWFYSNCSICDGIHSHTADAIQKCKISFYNKKMYLKLKLCWIRL